MNRSTVDTAAGILSGIKLNRIQNKTVKTTLLNDYIRLRKFAKETADSVKDVSDKFYEDWGKEKTEVEKLVRERKAVTGYDEYLKAEKDAEAIINDILSEEVDVQIIGVSFDDFITAVSDEELSLEQVAFLQEIGIVQ
jgi:hypothetical protein